MALSFIPISMKYIPKMIALVGLFAFAPFAFASDGWTWTAELTPGAENVLVTEEGETQESYSNGNLSTDILLSEVLPNPEGSDTEEEWIEIYNAGSTDVDLGNWSLDDEEEGSSAYVFPAGTQIEAQDFLVIYRSNSDISLNNDADEVRLFDFEGTLQDSVLYESSPEGQSYARISLARESANAGWMSAWIPTARAETFKETPWEWTSDLTLGALNPLYYFIEGTIQEMVAFENKVILDDHGTLLHVSLNHLELNEELKKSIFSPGNTIQGYATLISENLFELKRLAETNLAPSSNSPTPKYRKILLLTTLALGAISFYVYQTHTKKDQA